MNNTINFKIKSNLKAGVTCSIPDKARNDGYQAGYNDGFAHGQEGDWTYYNERPNLARPRPPYPRY